MQTSPVFSRLKSILALSFALLATAMSAQAIPIASLVASPNPANEGTGFTLSGSATATDPDETVVSYTVERLTTNGASDPAVLYSGFAPPTLFLTAPQVPGGGGSQSFRLTATSINSVSVQQFGTADTTLVVNNVNQAPTANAGAGFNVREFRTGVQLSGSGNDPDGSITSYAWTQIGGTPVTLSNANSATPTFTAPAAPTTLTFQLVVTDNQGAQSAPASVNVSVQPNSAPSVSAVAQPSQPFEGATVTLDGTASDANNDPLTYQWVQISGPQVITITNATSVDATFTAPSVSPAGETYVFQLTASDGLASTSAQATVAVKNQNQPPVSNPTTPSTTVNAGATVILSGAASTDPDNDPLTYAWTQNQGPTVTLNGANTASASFVAPAVTVLTAFRFRLAVDDGQGGSDAKNIVINVQPVVANNIPPTITSVTGGPSPTVAGTTVSATVVATDPDGDSLTYLWDQDRAPFVQIINSTSPTASFVAPAVSQNTTFHFRITVSDGRGGIAKRDDLSIEVLSPSGASSGIPLISDVKTYPSPFSPAKGGATIHYNLRSDADVTVLISDIFGRQVREFRFNPGDVGGRGANNEVHWDGRNGEGDMISNGAYIIQIKANDGLGAQGKVTDKVGVRR